MKHIENVVLIGFILFILGGACLVGLQFLGLILKNGSLVTNANAYFTWIYPVAAITGLLCYLVSYRKK